MKFIKQLLKNVSKIEEKIKIYYEQWAMNLQFEIDTHLLTIVGHSVR